MRKTTFRVCPTCKGHGRTAPAWTFTSDEMHEQGPEFAQDYADGVYDRTCPDCEGERVVDASRDIAAERGERRDERRLYALESGDVELFLNPDL